MADRRSARRDAIAPVFKGSLNPNHVTQQIVETPRGPARGWFKGGVCHRVLIAGVYYRWGEGPDVWAAILDGSFRPNDFGKHNSRQ